MYRDFNKKNFFLRNIYQLKGRWWSRIFKNVFINVVLKPKKKYAQLQKAKKQLSEKEENKKVTKNSGKKNEKIKSKKLTNKIL